VDAPIEPASQPKLAVIGDAALDHYLTLPAQQSADEKVTATSSIRLPGGTGANAAAAAAALGSQVSLYSAVGTDGFGDWLVQSLASRGVITSGVRTVAGTTTQATILLQTDGRLVIVDRGVADTLDELDPAQIWPADIIYVTGSSAAIRRIAEGCNPDQVVAGVEADMLSDALLADVLGNVDLIITNSAGWAAVTEKSVSTVTAVETRGADGAVIHSAAGTDLYVPGLPVDAVDTTGAGDCLAGAVCHYLASGLDLISACQLGVAAAALSTRALGAQSALPADVEVRAAARRHRAFPSMRDSRVD
jgi:ribokinase